MITPAIDTFKRKTGYNLRVLFESFNSFINNHYQNIVDYYNGADIVQDSFIMLEYLLGEVKKVEPLFDQYSNGFNTTDFWSIITAFSDMQCKLETCENMGKWQRSSRLNRFSSNINIAHVQEQNETIEKIAQKAGYLGVDKWVDIAIDNQMEEEDYTNAGGALFTIKLPNNSNFDLDNIIDNLSLTNIYGKDIERKITILSDGDLATLSGKDSLRQTFETIMTTIKGSIPEFPDDGVPNELFGSNENVIQYPILMRGLLNMIQKDKRFSSFDILDIKKDQDSIFIEVKATAITGDSFINNIII